MQIHQFAKFLQCAPRSEKPTEYDAKHLSTYLLLLEAESEGAELMDMTIFFDERGIRRTHRQLLSIAESQLNRARQLGSGGRLVEW
jgi:hypothetical protein